METMNLNDFRSALERAGKFKGETGVVAQKKLILDKYMIVDENGLAVDPESLDITISAAAPAPEMEEDSMNTENLEEKIAKSVRSALVANAAPSARPMAVVAEPKAWDTAKQYGKLKAFKSKENAYRFGSWCLAAMGHQKSAQFCKNNGIHMKAHTEGVNSAGGFLVPDEFENELISLRESYGVFRRNAKIYPMGSDTLRIPKRTAGLTAYFVGEANAGTESTQTLDSVQLVAKKLMCLTTVSNELLEDAIVNIGDDIGSSTSATTSRTRSRTSSPTRRTTPASTAPAPRPTAASSDLLALSPTRPTRCPTQERSRLTPESSSPTSTPRSDCSPRGPTLATM